MNKSDARKIAETITNIQLQEMFNSAKNNIIDWNVVSDVNKSITKGFGWNILAKDFDINTKYHILSKTNMIREFGDYLPEELKIKHNKKSCNNIKPIHQNPIFNNNIIINL